LTLRERLAASARFFRRGLDDFDTTANFVASSPWLVEAMLASITRDAKIVVEFGPGTGTLTRAILARLGPDARVFAIELDEGLLESCVRAIDDRRLVGVHGSAVDAAALLPASVVGAADAVVSSLGLSLMDEPVRAGVMRAGRALLAPEGVFSQYAYVHARHFAYSAGRRQWFRWDARPFVRKAWPRVEERMIWANLPPALVFRCRGA
jgi:phosphatidylethanolamine/phosphatidyl-N-methylethanolamine N-methyltransferase